MGIRTLQYRQTWQFKIVVLIGMFMGKRSTKGGFSIATFDDPSNGYNYHRLSKKWI